MKRCGQHYLRVLKPISTSTICGFPAYTCKRSICQARRVGSRSSNFFSQGIHFPPVIDVDVLYDRNSKRPLLHTIVKHTACVSYSVRAARSNAYPLKRKIGLKYKTFAEKHDSSDSTGQLLSSRLRKRRRLSPAECLSLYLNKKTVQERRQFLSILDAHGLIQGSALPTLLLRYLQCLETPEHEPLEAVDVHIKTRHATELHASIYTLEDVHTWAWILRAPVPDARITRFLTAAAIKKQPRFLLLHVINYRDLSPEILQRVLVYCWNDILEIPTLNPSETSVDTLVAGHIRPQRTKITGNNIPLSIEHNAFMILISRLLHRARETWPAALVSIAQMITIYMEALTRHANASDKQDAALKAHQRISVMFNAAMGRLSLPAKTNPMRNAQHSWHAQQVLLAAINVRDKPIVIARSSYRAVCLTLAASKKSHDEEIFSQLMRRTWPPFRRVLDGVDAARPVEDDLSRVVRTNIMMRTAGYANDHIDEAIMTIGGREPNGSPTILTRSLMKRVRAVLRTPSLPRSGTSQAACVVSVASILATRDVREAWAAFVALPWSVPPTSQMYLVMFEKINSYNKHLAKGNHSSLPGDGKEVVAAFNDNLSESEQERLQPPSMQSLYRRMIKQGIRPSGRLLEHLVAHAPTFSFGARVLQDSDLPVRSVAMLLQHQRLTEYSVIRAVSRRILTAYIKLLGRLARAIPVKDETESTDPIIAIGNTNYHPRTPRVHRAPKDPLLFALELLNVSGTTFRPAWYALFSRIIRRDTVFSPKHFGTPQGDVLAYQILQSALRDAMKIGLRIDAHGFLILCIGLERAIVASQDIVDKPPALDFEKDTKSLKQIFQQLSGTIDSVDSVDKTQESVLLHNIGVEHLHAYVRVLCLREDLDGLLDVVKFLQKHQVSVSDAIQQSRNGFTLLKRILICIRAFLHDLEVADSTIRVGRRIVANDFITEGDRPRVVRDRHTALQIRQTVESFAGWGGWPSEEEAQTYLQGSHQHVDLD